MEWISVKDRLPNAGVSVLIYDVENDKIEIGRFLYSQKSFPVFGIWGQGQTFDITHWCPLPNPPQQ